VGLRESHRSIVTAEFGRTAGNGLLILESLFQMPIINVQDAATRLGITYQAANGLVQRMVDAGILFEMTGQSRYRVFEYRPYIGLFASVIQELAYIAGLLLAWRLAMVLTARPKLWAGETPPYLPEKAETLLFMLTMGVILGGRLGFVLFYNWDYYSQNPAEILKTWQGGMAFHGGLIGVVVGGLIFCWLNKAPILSTADSIAGGCALGDAVSPSQPADRRA